MYTDGDYGVLIGGLFDTGVTILSTTTPAAGNESAALPRQALSGENSRFDIGF